MHSYCTQKVYIHHVHTHIQTTCIHNMYTHTYRPPVLHIMYTHTYRPPVYTTCTHTHTDHLYTQHVHTHIQTTCIHNMYTHTYRPPVLHIMYTHTYRPPVYTTCTPVQWVAAQVRSVLLCHPVEGQHWLPRDMITHRFDLSNVALEVNLEQHCS